MYHRRLPESHRNYQGLGAFLWALRSGQFDDLDGAAERILYDEDDELDPTRSGPDRPTTPSSR